MEPFMLIFLSVLGLVIIFASFFVSEKMTKTDTTTAGPDLFDINNMTEEGKHFLVEKYGGSFTTIAEEVMENTEDQLSKISNEKIMAMSEYSDQILDKIEQNHKEVIFMYNMLSEKENEIKKYFNQTNSDNKINGNLKENLNENPKDNLKDQDKQKANPSVTTKSRELSQKNSSVFDYIEGRENERVEQKGSIELLSHAKSNKQNTSRRRKRNAKKSNSINQENKREYDKKIQSNEQSNVKILDGNNNNEKILSLYQEGKSVVDIAKTLDLGQGEVKLVIDLYQGVK